MLGVFGFALMLSCINSLRVISLAVLLAPLPLALLPLAIVSRMEERTASLALGLATLSFGLPLALAGVASLEELPPHEWALLPIGCCLIIDPELICFIGQEAFISCLGVRCPVAIVAFMADATIKTAVAVNNETALSLLGCHHQWAVNR